MSADSLTFGCDLGDAQGDRTVYYRPLRWYAVYVRSRHEGRVAKHLDGRSVEFFFPHCKEERIWSDRVVEIDVPLFPGYLFVRIDLQERMRVLESPGVLYLVGASGRPEAMKDVEIEQLRMATQKQHDPRPHPLINVGERVVITRGPLEGSKGILVREKNKSRVVLQLDLIQKAMSVELDADAIAPAMHGTQTEYPFYAGHMLGIPGTRGDR